MANWRALCEELVRELHGYKVASPMHDRTLLNRARAALAQPEPEVVGPTDEELLSMAADCFAPVMVHFAHAVLARWGRPASAPDDRGVLPMIVSETGADDEPELERIICASISGGADYVNSMPRELSLERITPEGSIFARYIQVDADARPDVRPAPVPAEVLSARPLLEQIAALSDCIGEQTVGQVIALADRAAAWLSENPPGKPVAIEPRGCPTPVACSCVELPAPAPDFRAELQRLVDAADEYVSSSATDDEFFTAKEHARTFLTQPEPEVVAPTDEEIIQEAIKANLVYRPIDEEPHVFSSFVESHSLNQYVLAFAHAVLARWGRPASAPAGEVGEFADALRDRAARLRAAGLNATADEVEHAADLLERQAAPVPVAMSERLPWSTEPNISGRYICLRGDVYTLYDVDYYRDAQMGISGQLEATEVCKGSRVVCTVASLQPAYWLLVTALPLPSGEVEHG